MCDVIIKNLKKYEINEEPIRSLKRCTKCVLPETMPYIEFDKDGVCNYCNTYKKHNYEDFSKLKDWANIKKQSGKTPDSLVSFSGGRDSSFGLHYFVKELGLKPIAYTYDWGMVTDLAKRNQKKMCDSLGVKLITITADITKKRKNIKNNITAWIKKPDIGMIPLFMAGDKQFFYFANKTKKQFKLNDILMASNPLEQTHFKSGFCRVKPAVLKTGENSSDIEKLPVSGYLKMSGYYFGQYLKNPSYINSSLADTFNAAICNFIIPHKYLRLYDYIKWDETLINNVLSNEYNWEKAADTESTWRIGDGTAPFYNYLYYIIAGFTENDTLRSNQIREGMIDREKALELTYRDNQPRFESLKWYFDIINMDMEMVLDRVNKIPKLYNK